MNAKKFIWDKEKNKNLLKERGISFEMISKALEDDRILDIINYPSRPNQRIIVVELAGYAILVPFVQDDEHIFLKTAFPSRKFTRKYLRRDEK